MLKELIHTKINEVFAEYQEANNITSGDIDVADALALDTLETYLAEHIKRVCDKQPKKEPPASFYVYRDSEGIAHSVTYKHDETDRFFTSISRLYAFDDCSNDEITEIYWHGIRVEYAGWQSGMRFEYKDLNGKTVWVGVFEHWDH